MDLEKREEDAWLIGAAIEGDREAFGELYRRHARAVHGTLLATVAAQEADDMVHDVFLQALDHLTSLRDRSLFRAWICAIARRKSIDHFRRARVTDELDDTAVARENPAVEAEAHEAIAAIRRLPEAYRETLALRLVEGLSGPEIAEITGLTPDSVRVNLHRGFQLLRERLGLAKR